MKMGFGLLTGLTLIFTSAAGASVHSQANRADDFSVLTLDESSLGFRALWVETDCRGAIKNEICLVEPAAETEMPYNRVCKESAVNYAAHFEKLYDRLPFYLQKMFCHLSRIFIEKDFAGSAYGSLYQDRSGKILGGMLGIRESLLTSPPTLDEWATWKEQIHFGVDPAHVNREKGLPEVSTSLNGDPTDALYFLVAHEFAHMLDFTNFVNHDSSCVDHPGRKDCSRKSWHKFSWDNHGEPLPADNFPLRQSLCYYFCRGVYISAERQDELYRNLRKTNFLTPYATRFASEDFADTVALNTIWHERRANYFISTAHQRYDVIQRLLSADLKPKRDFIERFLNSDYLYPGE